MTLTPITGYVVFLGETFPTISDLRAELIRRVKEHPDRKTSREHCELFSRRFKTREIKDHELT